MRKLFFILLLVSNTAFAITQNGIQPTLVGSEANGTVAYIGISPNTNSCLYSAVYFTSPFDAKVAISVALAAKMAGKTLRIDYSIVGGSQCIGSAIFVE